MTAPDVLRIQIDGMKLEPINRSRWASKRGAMAHARKIREIRQCVATHVMAAINRAPMGFYRLQRVVVTRLSAGELDRGAAWEAVKPVWDGIADGLRLPNDRDIQKTGDVLQVKCPRGECGVVIELFFAERRASGT